MKILNTRDWDGGVEGQEITVELPAIDRLVIILLSEDGTVVDCELTIQHDGQGRAEITMIDGSATFYT